MGDKTIEKGPNGGTRTTETLGDGTKVRTTTGGDSGNTSVQVTSSSGASSTIHVNGKTGETKATQP